MVDILLKFYYIFGFNFDEIIVFLIIFFLNFDKLIELICINYKKIMIRINMGVKMIYFYVIIVVYGFFV